MPQENLKQSVKAFWDNEPCGTDRPASPEGSLAYFEEIENYRYRVESCIHEFAQFTRWHKKKVLEVGCGTGTDLLQFAKAGAEAYAIDLSTHSVSLAQTRLKLYGVNARIQEADAEHLPFADDTFDLVYSWGVIHHTPDTETAVKEIYRVSKPGGQIRIMIYNRHSWIALKMYVRWGLFTGKFFSSLSTIFSRHFESPGTKTYTRKETQKLFAGFRNLDVRPILTYYDYFKAKNIFPPTWLVRLLGEGRGWFILISGKKPETT
jgi:ubiquinone/menaquinone biosynthesis C-methylase UbiE